METLLFGQTGLRVSRFALGTMTFGTSWGFGADEASCDRILSAYLDAGGNFIDTADKYTDGEAERILGRLLRGRRREVILATKYSLCTDTADVNSFGNHRRNLVLSVEDSLRRLDTDFIDLLWVHAWYFDNEVEDVVRALDDLVRTGKVLYWGFSDTPAWICAEARALAAVRGWAPMSALQMEYSLIERTGERELLPFARHHGVAVTGSIPLGGGLLSGKHHDSGGRAADTARAERATLRRNPRIDAIVELVRRLASERGMTLSQLALAWLLHARPVVPILGVRTLEQLEDNLGALRHEIDDETVEALNEASAIELGFPHDMLRSARMREVMYGPFAP